MQPFGTDAPASMYISKYSRERKDDASTKIKVPEVATKASLPFFAMLLDVETEDEEDARFESTTVTVAPPPTNKAPP